MLFVLKILCYKSRLVSNVGVMYYCCHRACEGYYCEMVNLVIQASFRAMWCSDRLEFNVW